MTQAVSQHSDAIGFCRSLVGLPWVSGARGPREFDCWGLLVHVYRKTLGIELPPYPNVDAKDTLKVTRLLVAGAEQWEKIQAPEPFCAVGMSSNLRINHVGLWLPVDDGGILHAADNRGVVFQSIQSVRMSGLSNITFYRFKP